jgi:hypothetical protein
MSIAALIADLPLAPACHAELCRLGGPARRAGEEPAQAAGGTRQWAEGRAAKTEAILIMKWFMLYGAAAIVLGLHHYPLIWWSLLLGAVAIWVFGDPFREPPPPTVEQIREAQAREARRGRPVTRATPASR